MNDKERLMYHQSHRTIEELNNKCMKGKCDICK